MRQKRIIVSATNDLATDQRLKRHCGTLHEAGYIVVLTGRLLAGSLPVGDRPYPARRVRHIFNRGPLFYAEYNIRLFFYLLFRKCDIFHANDLDTLPANFMASLIRRKPLVYDSHELFTEVPELAGRPVIRKTWEIIEKLIFRRLRYIITVNSSIAREYEKKYRKKIIVIRNLPFKYHPGNNLTSLNFGLPEDQKLIILQGAGINKDRGAEEAVEAMQYIDNAVLVIAGKGDAVEGLKERVTNSSLASRVFFIPAMPYERLMKLTSLCDCGLSVDKDSNLNYRYSLPNKLFDYIMAGIPVVVSDLPELRKIVEKYGVGLIIEDFSPKGIAEKINLILSDRDTEGRRDCLRKAAEELNWDNEKKILISLYNSITRDC